MTAKKTTKAVTVEDTPDASPAASEATEAAGWPDGYVEHVTAAEAAAQRSVCNIPDGKTPKALIQALERRVEVNLAQADGVNVIRVGGADPKVRDLESPYSKRKPSGSA